MEIIKKSMESPINLIEQSLKIYREKFSKLVVMLLALIAGFLPIAAILIPYFIVGSANSGSSMSIIFGTALVLLSIIAVLLTFYILILASVGMYLIVKDEKNQLTIKDALKESRKYVFKFFGLKLLLGIILLALTLLFIIPGIIFSVYFSLAVWAMIAEEKDITDSIKRSYNLVKGYWWAVLGRGLLLGLFFFALFLLLSLPYAFIQDNSVMEAIWGMILQIFQFLIAPIQVIFSYLIYKNLVEIKK